MIHLPHLHRPGSSRCTSRRSSADYSHHPHPPAASLRPPTLDASPSSSPSPWSSRRSSACWSDRSCEGLTPDRTVDLWRCMLDLQGRYACYHSARIDVAMEAGHEDAVRYMRTCSAVPPSFLCRSVGDMPVCV